MYFKLEARFKSMAAFTMLRPMSLVTMDMVLQGFFFRAKQFFNLSFKVFRLLIQKINYLNLFRVKMDMLNLYPY